jgi:hypothetical protein
VLFATWAPACWRRRHADCCHFCISRNPTLKPARANLCSDAAKEQAEAEARRETLASGLAERERRLADARAELDRAQKEARHVDAQVLKP